MSALQELLRHGPVSQSRVEERLEQLGIRRVELADLYLVAQEHSLADFVDNTWHPRGHASPLVSEDDDPPASTAIEDPAQTIDELLARLVSQGATERRHVPPPRPPSEPPLEPRLAREIEILRRRVQLPLIPQAPAPAGRHATDWPELASAAADALTDELTAVTARRTQTDVALRAGQLTMQSKTRSLMRFEVTDDIPAHEGMSATLILKDEHVEATVEADVISVFGDVVTLAVPPGLPSSIDRAVLRVDLSWLLVRQKQRLLELRNGGPGFDSEAASAVVRPTRSKPSGLMPRPTNVAADPDLNREQQLAVCSGMLHQLTWLWGPPGTGKTTTLSVLVEHLMAQGKRILLAAPTNRAVDVALVSVLHREARPMADRIVRVGQPSDLSLIRRPVPVLVDEIAARRGEPIATRLDGVRRSLAASRAELKQPAATRAASTEIRRLRLEGEIADLVQLERELVNLLKEVRRDICASAQLVAATAHQVVLSTLEGLTFDVVILDEASMTTAALAALVAGAGAGHTVIAGDFRQLPPVAMADTLPARRWLTSSPFERAGIDKAVEEGVVVPGLVALKQQHRMRPAISAVISEAFYVQNPLIDAESVSRRASRPHSLLASPLTLIDTSSLNSPTARRGGLFSRYNLTHALLALALLARTTSEEANVGLISPFAPQARLLEALTESDGLEQTAKASTVHRFQGGESDVVVYDSVDTGRGISKVHPWFEDQEAGSTGARLLNVAASRARDHLVVLANLDAIHRHREQRGRVQHFLRAVDDRASRLDWAEILAKQAIVQAVPEPAWLHLLLDVDTAFLNGHRVDMWLPGRDRALIRPLLDHVAKVPRGVGATMTLWVDARHDIPAVQRLAESVRAPGVQVRLCRPLAESHVVAGDVVWSATASLLSREPGTAFRAQHAPLATALTRIHSRREAHGRQPISDGDTCGSCRAPLVRYESAYRKSARTKCPGCDA